MSCQQLCQLLGLVAVDSAAIFFFFFWILMRVVPFRAGSRLFNFDFSMNFNFI